MSELSLPKKKVSTAVGALLQLSQKGEKDVLLEQVGEIQLQICLKKIPSREKLIKLKLPNSLKHEEMDVCLFVKDLDKVERDYEPTVRHFQDLLRKQNVNCVSEIIPLKSLKTEYKPFEAKRNLSNAYDVFLADARIVRLLPTYLGKFFYGKKKHPVSVNLLSKHLSRDIDTAVGNSLCEISDKGSSSLAKVATVKMSEAEITANVLASVSQISEQIPGGRDNIRQLSLKTETSTSIPIYMSAGGPQEISISKATKKSEVVEAEEISTLLGAKVKVYPSGRIEVIRNGQEEPEDEKVAREKEKERIKKKNYRKKKIALKKKKQGKFEKKEKGTTKRKAVPPSTEKSLTKKETVKSPSAKVKKSPSTNKRTPAKRRKISS